jgi:hypothetical protein
LSSLIASNLILLLQSENEHVIITAWERRVGFNDMLCINCTEL